MSSEAPVSHLCEMTEEQTAHTHHHQNGLSRVHYNSTGKPKIKFACSLERRKEEIYYRKKTTSTFQKNKCFLKEHGKEFCNLTKVDRLVRQSFVQASISRTKLLRVKKCPVPHSDILSLAAQNNG